MNNSTRKKLVKEMSQKIKMSKEQYEAFKGICDDLELEPVDQRSWKDAIEGKPAFYLIKD